MELKKKLGKRIQELRIKNGLKQSELAEKVGIATKHQSCIETGKNYPSADLVEKYAITFNIDVEDLLRLEHIKTTQKMVEEIMNNLSTATEQEITIAYKILNGVFR